MLETIITVLAAFAVFSLFILVFTLKSRKTGEPVKFHTCGGGGGEGCTCGKDAKPREKTFELPDVIEKAKNAPDEKT